MRLRNLRIGRQIDRWLAFKDPRHEWFDDLLFACRTSATPAPHRRGARGARALAQAASKSGEEGE